MKTDMLETGEGKENWKMGNKEFLFCVFWVSFEGEKSENVLLG